MRVIERQVLKIIYNAKAVQTKELINIFVKRGYQEMTIRNLLSFLKSEKLITSPQRGIYNITSSGKGYVNTLRNKKNNYVFDGHFLFIIIKIPETQRRQKDKFKKVLCAYGFGRLSSDIYISPYKRANDIRNVATNMKLINYLRFIDGVFIGNKLTECEIKEVWRLDKVKELYCKIHKEFNDINKTYTGNLSSEELFNLYLDYEELINRILSFDPFLPSDLLPNDWHYQDLFQNIISNYHDVRERLRDTNYQKFIEKTNFIEGEF